MCLLANEGCGQRGNWATGKFASLGSGFRIIGDAATFEIHYTAFWIGDIQDGSLGVVDWQGGGLDVSNAKGAERIDGNGEGSEIENGESTPGALKFWRRWKREYVRWNVSFDLGEPPKILEDAKK